MSFTLIAGPCVIESRDLALEVAERVKEITDRPGDPLHLQGELRQGEPQLRRILSRPRRGGRPGGAGRG